MKQESNHAKKLGTKVEGRWNGQFAENRRLFYIDRIADRNSDYCDSGRDASPRSEQGKGEGQTDFLHGKTNHQQKEANSSEIGSL